MGNTENRDMYLKYIYEMGLDGDFVAVSQVSKRLGVSPVSASEMIKRLEQLDLVEHTPYKGVKLKEKGLQRALKVVRRQRLWECFMIENLKMPWPEIYEHACRLEHATDDVFTETLADYLGHPEVCPHGNPIPDKDGKTADVYGVPLSELEICRFADILRIDQPEGTLSSYLYERGILPGTRVQMVDEAPFNGPFTIVIGEQEIALGREISSRVIVTPLDD